MMARELRMIIRKTSHRSAGCQDLVVMCLEQVFSCNDKFHNEGIHDWGKNLGGNFSVGPDCILGRDNVLGCLNELDGQRCKRCSILVGDLVVLEKSLEEDLGGESSGNQVQDAKGPFASCWGGLRNGSFPWFGRQKSEDRLDHKKLGVQGIQRGLVVWFGTV